RAGRFRNNEFGARLTAQDAREARGRKAQAARSMWTAFRRVNFPCWGHWRKKGLIRARPPSVQFAHDLIGDWARYRILKFEGHDAHQMVKALAPIPRWGRAIRLSAQSLAEHGAGLAHWKASTAKLTGDDA